jgi:ankyrin repeat protein
LLLHADVNFNLADNDGNTPLILASLNGNTSCVKALLYYAEHQSRFESEQMYSFISTMRIHKKIVHVSTAKLFLSVVVRYKSKL